MHQLKPKLAYVRDDLFWPGVVAHQPPGIQTAQVAFILESVSIDDMLSAKA